MIKYKYLISILSNPFTYHHPARWRDVNIYIYLYIYFKIIIKYLYLISILSNPFTYHHPRAVEGCKYIYIYLYIYIFQNND